MQGGHVSRVQKGARVLPSQLGQVENKGQGRPSQAWGERSASDHGGGTGKCKPAGSPVACGRRVPAVSRATQGWRSLLWR